MRESKGKAFAREHFYRACLSRWMTPGQLNSGSVLILLGDEPREIKYLDELGIDRSHIWSVEKDEKKYRKQEEMKLGISLYKGEMADYLWLLLHSDQSFVVLNLDIEGSYLNHLDPAMSSVLLFCWRNPETVLATYSNVGRDTNSIREGAKSFILFFRLYPELTMKFCQRMASRYQQSNYTKPFNMVLRDLFWLRSVMEHALITASYVDIVTPEEVEIFFAAQERLWEIVCQKGKMPLTFRQVRELIEQSRKDKKLVKLYACIDKLRIGLKIRNQQHVIYRANPPYSHRAFYTKLISREPSYQIQEWLTETMEGFLSAPLIYIDSEGKRTDLYEEAGTPDVIADSRVISDIKGLLTKFKPRVLSIEPLRAYQSTIDSVKRRRQQFFEKTGRGQKTKGKGSATVVPALPAIQQKEPKMPKTHFMRNHKLTGKGRERLRELAKAGHTVAEIQGMVPESVPERSIRAFVAIAHRTPKKAKKK